MVQRCTTCGGGDPHHELWRSSTLIATFPLVRSCELEEVALPTACAPDETAHLEVRTCPSCGRFFLSLRYQHTGYVMGSHAHLYALRPTPKVEQLVREGDCATLGNTLRPFIEFHEELLRVHDFC